MAFTVTPVSVRLRLISPLLVAAVSAISCLLSVGGAAALPVGNADELGAWTGAVRRRCGTTVSGSSTLVAGAAREDYATATET